MFQISRLSTLACVILFISCGTRKAASETAASVPAAYQKQVEVDGNAADWTGVPVNSSPSGAIQYSIANNEEQLFIMFRVADQAEQMKLLSQGVEISISPLTKDTKPAEIIYPVKGELNQSEVFQQAEDGAKLNKETIRKRMTIQLISLNRIGFKPEYNGVQGIHQNTGFRASLGWNTNDDLIYEVALPLRALPFSIVQGGIRLAVHVDGMERPSQRPADGQSGWNSTGRGRMGGGGYGGYRGGYYGGSSAGRQNEKAFEKESFRTTYQIAQPR